MARLKRNTKANSGKAKQIRFKFRRGSTIGEAAAEDDNLFLRDCFVDTGALSLLLDPAKPEAVVVGRTGSGKSALLAHIKDNVRNVVEITPENLSLRHISNSTILQILEGDGVKIDVFYEALWKHVLAVELIKARYGQAHSDRKNIISRLYERAGLSQSKKRAVKYLEKWGEDQFWNEVNIQAQSVTSRFEDELNSAFGADSSLLNARASVSSSASDETKAEFVNKAQRVVDALKIRDLQDLINMLSEDVFNDVKSPYYIVIDDLDRDWAEDRVRYKLIRALIETIKRFRRIPNVKVIISVRKDLLDKVFEETRGSGFQEEKYESMHLKIRWSDDELRDIILRRLNKLVRPEYTKEIRDLYAILPARIGETNTFQYINERTLKRPRDLIQFMNAILNEVVGKSEINVSSVRAAEKVYSMQRRSALVTEWIDLFPDVRQLVNILSGQKKVFKVENMDYRSLNEFVIDLALSADRLRTERCALAKSMAERGNLNGHRDFLVLIRKTFFVLHKIGVIGLKVDSQASWEWNLLGDSTDIEGRIGLDALVAVHPMYLSALGMSTLGEVELPLTA